MVLEGKIKRWGNSYGILITKEEIKKKKFHENETVLIDIKKKKDLSPLFGLCHFKRPTKEIIKEIREGYDV